MLVSRKISVLLLVLSFALLGSCKEAPKKKENVLIPETSNSTIKEAPETGTSTSNQNVALNPAHGQPGHRCDIPVGAPLNSTSSSNNSNTQSGVPVSSPGDVKVNPPHGQPGHRCDVKVGDPLPE